MVTLSHYREKSCLRVFGKVAAGHHSAVEAAVSVYWEEKVTDSDVLKRDVKHLNTCVGYVLCFTCLKIISTPENLIC